MSLLESLSVTFLPPRETMEDIALGRHPLLGTMPLFLWTNKGHQALTGACFCHWLLYLCLRIGTALLGCKQTEDEDCYSSPGQRGVYLESLSHREGGLEIPMSKAHSTGAGRRESRTRSGLLMTFLGCWHRVHGGLFLHMPVGHHYRATHYSPGWTTPEDATITSLPV